MSDRRADDPSISVRLRSHILERMDRLCHDRMIGRRLVIERALTELMDRLEADDEL